MRLLLFTGILFILISSCGHDKAADGTKRGTLKAIKEIVKDGKPYTIFIYSRSENYDVEVMNNTEDYIITHTVDANTGKCLFKSTIKIGLYTAKFEGIVSSFALHTKSDGTVCAVDLFENDKFYDSEQLKDYYQNNYPNLKGQIFKIDASNNNLKILTLTGDNLYYNLASDKFVTATSSDIFKSEYSIDKYRNSFNNVGKSGNDQYTLHINRSKTLNLVNKSEENPNQKVLDWNKENNKISVGFGIDLSNLNYLESEVFIDAKLLGYKDSLCYLQANKLFGDLTTMFIGAFDLQTLKFKWQLDYSTIHKALGNPENVTYYEYVWSEDATRIYIYTPTIDYHPTLCIDAKKGIIKWTY